MRYAKDDRAHLMSRNGHPAPALNGYAPAMPAAKTASLSPSLHGLAPASRVAAFEVKFVLTEDQAHEVEDRLRQMLLPDPHADPALGGMYAVTSLACDDPDFGVFFRELRTKNRKYRVRRYGDNDLVFLERKRSRRGRVRKRRIAATVADLVTVAGGSPADASHAWFVREVRAGRLAPVCRLRYLRRALFGECPEGPMRVTLDRSIRGGLAREWSTEPQGAERALLDGIVVCEFKFRDAMPAPLKAIAAAMRLEATGVSKYRACVRAFAGELGLSMGPDAVHAGSPTRA